MASEIIVNVMSHVLWHMAHHIQLSPFDQPAKFLLQYPFEWEDDSSSPYNRQFVEVSCPQ